MCDYRVGQYNIKLSCVMGICGSENMKKCQNKQYSKSDFKFVKLIGRGGFGKVWKVTERKNNKEFALKEMDKAKIIAKKSVKAALLEREIMSTLLKDPSDFIVNIEAAFQDSDKLYLLTQYIHGRDLRYYINQGISLDQNQIKFLVICILKALQYLHGKKIIHRDIKPENIIIDDNGFPHLTDFGISEYYRRQNAHNNGGTIGYMAPQLLFSQNHSYVVDYYAVGIIIYELAFGKRPSQKQDKSQMMEELMKKDTQTGEKSFSEDMIDFISKLTQNRAKNRLGYCGISEIFEHSWLSLNSQQVSSIQWKQLTNPIKQKSISRASLNQTYDISDQEEKKDEDQNIFSNLLEREHVQKLFQKYNFIPEKQGVTDQSANKEIVVADVEKQDTQYSLKKYLKT